MHPISAVGDALEVAGLADNRYSRRREANRYSGVAGGNKLADTAPAKACRDWSSLYLETDSAAKASTGDHL
jgi:hypothetical protein